LDIKYYSEFTSHIRKDNVFEDGCLRGCSAMQFGVGLPGVRFLTGQSGFWRVCPVENFGSNRTKKCPVFRINIKKIILVFIYVCIEKYVTTYNYGKNNDI
jgi:hypothetical protein